MQQVNVDGVAAVVFCLANCILFIHGVYWNPRVIANVCVSIMSSHFIVQYLSRLVY